MSTISAGPSNIAVRRMMPIGSGALGGAARGVLHPVTPVPEEAPRVGGGSSGSAGGVGEAPPADGVTKGVGGGDVGGAPRSHAGDRSTMPTTPSASNLCMIRTLERREPQEG